MRNASLRIRSGLLLVAGCLMIIQLGGCDSGAKTGSLFGAGIGALAGQAIGGNTAATLIGTGIGAGVGYMIGNEDDKKRARRYSSDTRTRNYDHDETGPFAGTRWSVVSIDPPDTGTKYARVTVEFGNDSQVVTTYTYPDGTVTTQVERYRVVGNSLIVNAPNYLVNYAYTISGNELTAICEDFTLVLTRI